MYTFLVGSPGIGKSRVIIPAKKLCEELKDFHIAPTSMTMASLVDCLKASTRDYHDHVAGTQELFNSMTMFSDDWQASMADWQNDLVAGMTTFYDVIASYTQVRRTKDLNIKIKAPQLSILCGTTPSQLINLMPEGSWEQGFASRIMLIYSSEKKLSQDLFKKVKTDPKNLIHDLMIIHSLWGACGNTQEFIDKVNNWVQEGMPPTPAHPRLTHYNSRRLVHFMKLCIVACVDRGDKLLITAGDFDRAMEWLIEAEYYMPYIFQTGKVTEDAKAMDEIMHFVRSKGQVNESELVRFATGHVHTWNVMNVIEMMAKSHMIKSIGNNKFGRPIYVPIDA